MSLNQYPEWVKYNELNVVQSQEIIALKDRIKRLEKELSECNAHRERLIVSAMEAWGRIDEQEDSR